MVYKDGTCSQHLGIAVSCSKVEEMHSVIMELSQEIRANSALTSELDKRIVELKTQKDERWRVQTWWNITIITGLLGIAVEIYLKAYGGQ
jgi:hypothetical protein